MIDQLVEEWVSLDRVIRKLEKEEDKVVGDIVHLLNTTVAKELKGRFGISITAEAGWTDITGRIITVRVRSVTESKVIESYFRNLFKRLYGSKVFVKFRS